MKKIFVLLVSLISFQNSMHAQECMRDVSLLNESVKINNYVDAEQFLTKLLNEAPDCHPGIYIRGEQVFAYKIENAKSPEEKEKLVREANSFLDKFQKYFPDKVQGLTSKKAMNLFENNVGTKEEIFLLLEKVVKNELEETTNIKSFYTYFEMFVDKFEAGNDKKLEDVFELYDILTERIERESAVLSEQLDEVLKIEETQSLTSKQEFTKKRCTVNLEAIESIMVSMDAKVEKLSTCDRIVPLLEKNYDANKNNEEWLKRAATRLYNKECMDTDLFEKISNQLYSLNPTPGAAFNKGLNALKKGDRNKAIEFLLQAEKLYPDAANKAKVLFTIASRVYGMGNKSMAKQYCDKALSVSPSYEKAQLYIASLYANSVNEAADSPFDKRAVYWLAAQTARKTGTAKGNATASSYEQRAPSREDIFNSGKAGQQVCFKGWIGKCVTVPKL